MADTEHLPKPLEEHLKAEGLTPEAWAAADLTLDGLLGQEWLVVTDRSVLVFPDASTVPRVVLPLAALTHAEVDALVGGGAVVVVTEGKTQELVRFTNAGQRVFGRAVKHLSDVLAWRKDTAAGKTAAKPVLPPDPEERKRCANCRLLLPEGTNVCPACLSKGRVVLRLVRYLKPYWRSAAMVWLLMLAGLAFSLITPYINRPMMDRVLVPLGAAAEVPLADRGRLLVWLVAALLGSQVLGLAVHIVRGRIMVRLGTQLTHDLRTQLFGHLQVLSLRYLEKRSVGAMITRVMQDTQSLESVLVDGMQYLVYNILVLLGIGAVLFVMNWKLTLLVLIPVPIVLILSHLYWPRIVSLWHRYWHFRSRLGGAVSDTLSGLRVVKAFAREAEESQRFGEKSHDVQLADTAAEQTWTTFFPILWFVASAGSLLVWYVGGRDVLGGTVTLGTLMTFIAYLAMFYGPLQYLSRIADYLARSLTSAERVFEVLDSVSELKEAEDAVELPRIRGHVEFRGVTFGYEAHKPVLKNITLEVREGEMIGLVGHSGAGKSTTINLLCRFYDVNQGEVRIDGVDIRVLRQRDLRSQLGVVLQDTFLFNGTILENIRYAKPDASLEDVMAAAKAANAHDFIVQKADGYDTRVGERGQSLSAGERQRVSIARAILHNPRILILDEATASVDTETEKQIQEAIARLIAGRTTFAIAHRLSTLRNANRIVVLKKGEIVEAGTHEELLAKEGEFHKLVTMQREMAAVAEVAR